MGGRYASLPEAGLRKVIDGIVILKPGRERSVERRHPWIFSGAVDQADGSLAVGATVEVRSAKGKTLGFGCWSPESQIRVRLLSFGPGPAPDAAFVERLVRESVARRQDREGDPLRTPGRGVRLVHGESDGLPGLVADSYDGWCVIQCASAGAERWRSVVAETLIAMGAKGVYNRSDVEVRAREGLPAEGVTGVLAGDEPPERIEIREGSIRYLVDVRKGHKTGFYLDQREARIRVGALAAGREVLNCFSYTGGFGLACAAGGATRVENLDLSKDALALAERNFELLFSGAGGIPPVPRCPVTFCCADVFRQLRLYRDQGRQFGMIILDPPKFAETKSQLMRAARGYKDINLLAMKLLAPNGLLATFSCSGAMSPEFFATVCGEAACDARRNMQIVGATRQAADHPVSLAFPEGAYLKGLILRAIA